MTQSLVKTYSEARWLNDLDASGAETASDLESLIQDVAHIIVETLGSNGADRDKGVGVLNYLSGTSVAFAALPATIDAQLEHVSRITNSRTTMGTPLPDGSPVIAIAAIVDGAVVNFNFAVGPNGLSVAPAR